MTVHYNEFRKNLPLRGHRDDGGLANDEAQHDSLACEHRVFRALLGFLGDSEDTVLKEHLLTATNIATFISKIIQHNVIEVLGCYIQCPVFERVNKSKFFTPLCADTTDVSTQQQQTIPIYRPGIEKTAYYCQ